MRGQIFVPPFTTAAGNLALVDARGPWESHLWYPHRPSLGRLSRCYLFRSTLISHRPLGRGAQG